MWDSLFFMNQNSLRAFLRYVVTEKLGYGAFSTVWNCKDLKFGKKNVAVKVAKLDESAAAQARDEVELLKCTEAAGHGTGSEFVVKMVGHFEVKGPCGVHTCIALELLGPSLLYFLPNEGMCLENVKAIMKQVLEGLSFLHDRAQIIHTDIKPENILFVGCPPEADAFKRPMVELRVKVADLGSSCWVDKKFSVKIGTQEYRAPEVLLQAGYGTPADIWSSGCLAFELATADYLFMPKEACDPSEFFTKEEDHLSLITELLGPLPSDLVKRGQWRKYYKSTKKTDRFRNIRATDLAYKSLNMLLREDYKWKACTADDFSSWLLPMLRLYPGDRVTALESSRHPFVQAVQDRASRERKKLVRVRSETANEKMKCLASKFKNKQQKKAKLSKNGHASTPNSRVTKLRNREEELGSKLLRSGTPMTRLRAPLERPEERRRQAETRHKTAAGLPPLDILIPTGSPITAITSYR